MILSKYAHKLEGQPMFKVLQKCKEMEAAGRSLFHFEIGDPDFSTSLDVKKAAIVSIMNNKTHYTSSMGITELRKAVANRVHGDYGFNPSLDQIVITPGCNPIIYYSIRCLVNEGESVIIPDPGFSTYMSAVSFCGVVPLRAPLLEKNEFKVDVDDMRKLCRPDTRLIIINSPNNPTGSSLSYDDVRKIYELAEELDLYILSDEIYYRMIYDSKHFSPSVFDECRKRVILSCGVSKGWAMTGWRIGYCVCPPDLADKFGLLNQTIVSCLPEFTQEGAVAALGDLSYSLEMVQRYKRRRNLMVNMLNNIKGVRCLTPGGAFYVFPNIIGTGLTSQEFVDKSMEAGVVLLPGTDFGMYGEGYVRLCYANSDENIMKAMEILQGVFGRVE